ncbi:ribokinase [Alkalihalobacillus sp. BA299]|uniref:ribokinase n=1 Tax=Alkalihalobacillus sp. BA299 TaxID=2815938 RepID=UPI001ADAE4B9|nr:ribokinase [Alkalihalobacillus sp. BA299]
MRQKPRVTVVGSINMDLVTKADRFPKKGETILGYDYSQYPGGKGANQAVAAARLGADVSFIGCVGNDLFGEKLKQILVEEGINIEGLAVSEKAPTGVAQITVAEKENSIIVVPGANHDLKREWLEKHRAKLLSSDILLVQLEIPLDVAETVINIADENEIPVILNPAPAQRLDDKLLEKITYLTPNETEIRVINADDESNFDKQLDTLLERGVRTVILTRGEAGVIFTSQEGLQFKDSLKVEAVDTTGAGDTFNGALAVGVAKGHSDCKAVEFAIKAAALSVTKFGAQSGMPRLEEIENA